MEDLTTIVFETVQYELKTHGESDYTKDIRDFMEQPGNDIREVVTGKLYEMEKEELKAIPLRKWVKRGIVGSLVSSLPIAIIQPHAATIPLSLGVAGVLYLAYAERGITTKFYNRREIVDCLDFVNVPKSKELRDILSEK